MNTLGYGLALPSARRRVPFLRLLFTGGKQGISFDPSDLSTLFQDDAGTTPVAAAGDPVGLMLDKSGNGNHAKQATLDYRPLYQTDGTRHWIEFDGVDDRLVIPPIVYDQSLSLCIGVNRTDTNAVYGSFRSQTVTGVFIGYNHPSETGTTTTEGGTLRVNGQAATDDRSSLYNAIYNTDGVGTSEGNTSAFANADGEIFTYGGTTPPAGRLYGYLEVEGASFHNRAAAEDFIARRAGVTL